MYSATHVSILPLGTTLTCRRTIHLKPYNLPAAYTRFSTSISRTSHFRLATPNGRQIHQHPNTTPRIVNRDNDNYYRTKPRHFTSSSRLHNEPEPQTTFTDPSRPDLFYHIVFLDASSSLNTESVGTPVFAVSLLETPPPYASSSTVLGWLPAEGLAEGEGEDGGAGLNDFTENREFVCLESWIRERRKGKRKGPAALWRVHNF